MKYHTISNARDQCIKRQLLGFSTKLQQKPCKNAQSDALTVTPSIASWVGFGQFIPLPRGDYQIWIVCCAIPHSDRTHPLPAVADGLRSEWSKSYRKGGRCTISFSSTFKSYRSGGDTLESLHDPQQIGCPALLFCGGIGLSSLQTRQKRAQDTRGRVFP